MAEVDPTTMEILAWVGPDEKDGSRGIKSGVTPVGWIPLAFKGEHLSKAQREELRIGLRALASHYGNRIQLVRFTYAEVIETIEPES